MKQAGADEQSFGQHLAKLSNDVLGFGDAQAVAEKKNSLFRRGLAAASLATGLLEPQMASLIVTAGGLAAAAASAGLGFAAYAAAARPALQGVMQAVQAQGKVQAASTAAQGSYQAALAAAQTRYRLSLGSATTAAQRSSAATALLNAQHSALAAKVRATTLASANYKAQLAGLTPVQRALATGIVGAQKAYQGWAMQFARPILTPFIRMLSVVHPLLAAFSPVVRQAAAAIEILSNQFISVVQGGGLQRWLAGMIPHIAPVIISLGHIIGHLVEGIGGILRAFAPAGQGIMAWLDKITAAFAKWGQTLPQHTGFQSLFAMVNKDAPVLRDLLKNVAIAAVNVGRAMTGISTPANSRTLLVALRPVAALLAQFSRNQALVQMIFYMALLGKVTSRIKPAFDAAAGSIGGIYKAVRGLSSGAMDVGGLAGQINRFRAGFGDAAVAGGKLSGVAGTLGGKFRQLTSWIGSGIGSIREWGIWTKIAEGATALYEVSLGRAVLAIRSWTIWSKVAAVATKVWAAVQVAFNAVMDANPIALVVIGIAALIAIVILAYKRFAWFRDFVNTVGRFIAQHWQIMLALITGGLSLAVVFIIKHWTLILNIAKTVINWVRGHWALLLIALTGPFGLIVVAIIKNWNRILDTARTVINGIRIAWNAMGGFLRQVAMTFQGMWINVVAKILDVARAAFGWLPFGVGKNITAAANHFDTLRTRWNAAMHGMNNRKISIAVNMIDAAIGSGGGGGSGVNTGHSIAGRARGGPIRGPGGPEDDRAGLYALSHDEYVVRARAHRKYGTRFMDLINRGQLPEDIARIGRRAQGGPIRGPGDMASIDVQTGIPTERDMTGVMLPQLRKLAASWAKKHIFSGLWNPALSSAMVRYALQYVGRPYVWGGTTPAGWDCSGFTSWVYHHFGIPAPRTSQQQQLWARPSGDVPGALVFFYGRNGAASHVGLAIGGGQMVNAEDPAMGTRVASVGGNTGFGLPPGAVQNNIFGALFGGGGRQTPIELGRSMAAAMYGWRGAEWSALYRLWMRESGWNPNARNPSSGAAGIPQDITGNFHGGARGQISWGLRYIRQRYGDPLRAWSHETGLGWYDKGGFLPPGVSVAVNNTGRPERVVAPGQDRPEVTVNVGPVTVTEAADVDLLARRLGFGISAAGFA